MSVSVVAIVWCLLSLTVAVSFCLCLLQPYWFIHNDNMTSLGIYTYCYHDNHHHDVITLTPPGGRPKRLDDDETRAGKDLGVFFKKSYVFTLVYFCIFLRIKVLKSFGAKTIQTVTQN